MSAALTLALIGQAGLAALPVQCQAYQQLASDMEQVDRAREQGGKPKLTTPSTKALWRAATSLSALARQSPPEWDRITTALSAYSMMASQVSGQLSTSLLVCSIAEARVRSPERLKGFLSEIDPIRFDRRLEPARPPVAPPPPPKLASPTR